MKIIADAGGRTFILHAGESELARLCGYYYTGQEGCPRFTVGTEVKVNEMFDQLRGLAQRQKTLTGMAKDLRLLADLLELKEPAIFPPAEGGA